MVIVFKSVPTHSVIISKAMEHQLPLHKVGFTGALIQLFRTLLLNGSLTENIESIDSTGSWNTIRDTPYYRYNFIGSDLVCHGPMADEVPAALVRGTGRMDGEGEIRSF